MLLFYILSPHIMPRVLLRHAISNTFNYHSENILLSRFQSCEEGSSRQVSHVLVILLLLLYLLVTNISEYLECSPLHPYLPLTSEIVSSFELRFPPL